MAQEFFLPGDSGGEVRGVIDDNFTQLFTLVENKIIIQGTETTYALLTSNQPPASHTGEYWIVTTATGSVITFNRKSSGLYRSDGATWIYTGIDMEYRLTDTNFLVADDGDNTKRMRFEVSQVTTGTTRVISPADYDQDLAYPLFQTYTLDPTYTVTGSETLGTSYWDEDNMTYSDVLEGGVIGQRYEELFTAGQNDTGDTLGNGTVASYASSIGNSGNFKIEHTVASTAEHPLITMGIITTDIIDGGTGKVTTYGKVRGIQTDGANYGETWVTGIPVYKSPTIAGGLTMVPPNAPIPAIPLAVVLSAHVNNGVLFVRPAFPVKFTDLIDVNGTPLTTTGQIAVWDQAESYFDFNFNINDYALAGTAVTATNPFGATNTLLKSDGTGRGSQASGITENGSTVDFDALDLETTGGAIFGDDILITKDASTGRSSIEVVNETTTTTGIASLRLKTNTAGSNIWQVFSRNGDFFVGEALVGDRLKIGKDGVFNFQANDLINIGDLSANTLEADNLTDGFVPYSNLGVLDNTNAYFDGNNWGFGTDDPVVNLVVSESVNNSAVYFDINNQYIDDGSIGEVTKIRSTFGSNVVATEITTGKEEDFTISSNRSSYLAFSTRKDGSLSEKVRINSLGRMGVGYSYGTEINNHKLSINGKGYFNETVTSNQPATADNHLMRKGEVEALPVSTFTNDAEYVTSAYAEIHNHDSVTAQSITNGATYIKYTGFTDNGVSNNCTADAANDKITITKLGKYSIDSTFNFSSGTNNTTFFAGVFINGVEQDNIHFTRKVGTAGDVGSASATGFINITSVPIDLDFRFRHDVGAAVNITVSYANLNINYLGE